MPDRKFVLTTLVIALLFLVAWQMGGEFADSRARALIYLCAGLFSVALIRSMLLGPWVVARRWRRFAEGRGLELVIGQHGAPRLVGVRNGSRFVVAQSTALLGGGGGYFAQTTMTATIDDGIPDGLRTYRRDAVEWMHQLSGLREVSTTDATLDRTLMVEGTSAEETKRWMLARRAVFEELCGSYPGFIVYGAEIDGLPVPGGASGALTVQIVGRLSRAGDLDQLIDEVTALAARL